MHHPVHSCPGRMQRVEDEEIQGENVVSLSDMCRYTEVMRNVERRSTDGGGLV